MPNDSQSPNIEHTESAFALRAALKQTQSAITHDRLFERLGQRIFQYGWSDQLLQWLLDELAMLVGAKHGLIAQQHGGALKILAQRGLTYPIGSRIPMMGILGQWLKEPVNFDIHTQQVNALWTLPVADNDKQIHHFHHMPIAIQQRPIGLLALVSASPLSTNHIATIHSVCGLIALAIKTNPSETVKIDDAFIQKLTPREREIFALLPSGASNAALAAKLEIAPGTVKVHIERILSKLNLSDRTQAAVKAVEMGFKSDGLL